MIRHIPNIIEFLGNDPEPEPGSLSGRIAYARRRLGYTQEDLAIAIQASPFSIYLWESGQSEPSTNIMSKIQKLLGSRFVL